MDPANLIPGQEMDTHQLHQALSHQGALVGQHIQALYHLMTGMGRVFDHPVRGSVAANRLLTAHQCSLSVADYMVQFRITAAEVGWNDDVPQGPFKNGQCDRIKDELAPRNDSGNLNELITLAIRLDSRLSEHLRESASRAPSTSSFRLPWCTLVYHRG
ncbi:hypothetical protein DPEC_G00110750 [Dallia pectoralis]|uniref:Uncharacterized protein n=1 Tax=Dallia pectoralis TaxID=75939 RepID=A0ACC2GSQ7_DALPE|nr:hypothetical protein DPEC_G00110750 [Dallia pectoralis]